MEIPGHFSAEIDTQSPGIIARRRTDRPCPTKDISYPNGGMIAGLPEHFEIVESGAADAVLVTNAATRRGASVLVAADTLTAPASNVRGLKPW